MNKLKKLMQGLKEGFILANEYAAQDPYNYVTGYYYYF